VVCSPTLIPSAGESPAFKPAGLRIGPYSSVELHGCRVAQGRSRRQLLQQLAQMWNVPVMAAITSQSAGGPATFRFEGPVYTAFPGGLSPRQWASRLPDLAEVSVP
jgi:hypothetical protein